MVCGQKTSFAGARHRGNVCMLSMAVRIGPFAVLGPLVSKSIGLFGHRPDGPRCSWAMGPKFGLKVGPKTKMD